MNPDLGTKSILLLAVSILFLVALTLFETSLAGLPSATERIMSFLLLVLPAIAGLIFGVLSLARREAKPWVAILGVLGNALFALFHLFLLAFAG